MGKNIFEKAWDDITGKSSVNKAVEAQNAANAANAQTQREAMAIQDKWNQAALDWQKEMFNRGLAVDQDMFGRSLGVQQSMFDKSLAEAQRNQADQMSLARLGAAGNLMGQQLGLDQMIQLMQMQQAEQRPLNMARQAAIQQAIPSLMALAGLNPVSLGQGYTEANPQALGRNLLSELGMYNQGINQMFGGQATGQMGAGTPVWGGVSLPTNSQAGNGMSTLVNGTPNTGQYAGANIGSSGPMTPENLARMSGQASGQASIGGTRPAWLDGAQANGQAAAGVSSTTPWSNANVDVNKLLTMSPVAQFQMKQAEDAIRRSLAARGGLNSSEFTAQMGTMGGNIASAEAQNAQKRLWDLVNFGQGGQAPSTSWQSPNVSLSNIGQDMSQALNQSAANRQNLYSNFGTNMGSLYSNQGSGLMNAMSNAGSTIGNSMANYGNAASTNMSRYGAMNYDATRNSLGLSNNYQGGLLGGLNSLSNLANSATGLYQGIDKLAGLFSGGSLFSKGAKLVA